MPDEPFTSPLTRLDTYLQLMHPNSRTESDTIVRRAPFSDDVKSKYWDSWYGRRWNFREGSSIIQEWESKI